MHIINLKIVGKENLDLYWSALHEHTETRPVNHIAHVLLSPSSAAAQRECTERVGVFGNATAPDPGLRNIDYINKIPPLQARCTCEAILERVCPETTSRHPLRPLRCSRSRSTHFDEGALAHACRHATHDSNAMDFRQLLEGRYAFGHQISRLFLGDLSTCGGHINDIQRSLKAAPLSLRLVGSVPGKMWDRSKCSSRT